MPQTTSASTSSTRNDRSPIDKFVNGPVQVSIWENQGPKGAFRTATVQLRYKDEKEGWKTGTSYGVADLENLENAAKEARARIVNWQQRNKNDGARAAAG
jgi:hypothetical protein